MISFKITDTPINKAEILALDALRAVFFKFNSVNTETEENNSSYKDSIPVTCNLLLIQSNSIIA